jgi:hypothetical protein
MRIIFIRRLDFFLFSVKDHAFLLINSIFYELLFYRLLDGPVIYVIYVIYAIYALIFKVTIFRIFRKLE